MPETTKTDWSNVERIINSRKLRNLPSDDQDFDKKLDALCHWTWAKYLNDHNRVRANEKYYSLYQKLAEVRDFLRGNQNNPHWRE